MIGSWVRGEHGTGYLTKQIYAFTLALKWLGLGPHRFDCYLLKFPVNSRATERLYPWVDKEGRELRHFRLSVVLKYAEIGGKFFYVYEDIEEGTGYALTGKHWWTKRKRFFWFRPDITPHGVARTYKGDEYVLSLGFGL